MTLDVFGIVGTTQRGSFRVERAVAEGGFSVVYRAQHGAFRAPVALKCLKVPGTMTNVEAERFLEKLREEAELLFRLSATIPEVVRPLHVDALDLPDRFVPFLALEWLEGEALDQLLRRRREQGDAPMSLSKILRLLTPIARALSRAHRFPGPAGVISVVHRDVKPENIFIARVNGEESVKILDFGIAKAGAVAGLRQQSDLDEDIKSAFTPAYGAPEQWAPRQYGPSGPWTDVWGLAITVVEALAGGAAAIDGDVPQMMAAVLNPDVRPTPRSMGIVLPDDAERAFRCALEVDPARRTREIETFWSALEASVGLTPTMARRDPRRDPTGGDRQREAEGSSSLERSPSRPLSAADPSFAATVLAPDSLPPPSLPPLDTPSGRVAASPSGPMSGVPVSSAQRAGATSGAPVPSAPRAGSTSGAPVPSAQRSGAWSVPGDAPSSRPASRPRGGAQAELGGAKPSVDKLGLDLQLELEPAVDSRSGRDSVRRPGASPSGRVPPSARASGAATTLHSPAQKRDLRELLKLPATLVLVGCVIGVFDVFVAKALELPAQLGPLRAVWFSVGFLIGGTLLGFWRALSDDS